MPIGVPKVAYTLPGDESPQWVDLYNRLYRERVLFLASDLDDELTNQLTAIMMFLSTEDNEKRLFIYINSLGGSITCGLAVYDAMNFASSSVTTMCVGLAASMASFILATGEAGSRVALPHTRIMMHQPQSGNRGQSSDVSAESAHLLRLRKDLCSIYAKRTSKSITTISRDLDRDIYMSASEAKNYGIVDQVTKEVDSADTRFYPALNETVS